MTVTSIPQLKQEIGNLWTRSFIQGGDSWIKRDDVLEKIALLEKQLQKEMFELGDQEFDEHAKERFRDGQIYVIKKLLEAST